MKNPAPLLERPKNLKVFAELFLKKRLAEGTRPPRPLTDKSKFEKQGFPPADQKSRRLAASVTLKSSANRIRALLRVSRTHMDIFRCAIAISIVIYAILNRAVDALDVLRALSDFTHFTKDLSL